MSVINLVCLDTSVIRNIIDTSNFSKEFEEIKKKRNVKFRIAETAFAEILSDLFDKSISFTDWREKKNLINVFLDSSCPIQEQGYNLSVAMDTFKKPKKRFTFYKKKYWVKLWKHISSARNEKQLAMTLIYYHEHQPYKLKIQENLIEPAFEDNRRDWYKYFDDVKGLVNKNTSLETIIDVFSNEFSKDYNLEKMMDFVNALASYTYKFLSDKDFNPYSKKRRNDSIDFSFIQILAKPAIFCTSDKKFYNFIQNASAPNRSNLMSPDEVINYYNSN